MKWVLLLVAVAFILSFSRKLPEFARTIGGSVRAFREGKNERTTETSMNDSSKSR